MGEHYSVPLCASACKVKVDLRLAIRVILEPWASYPVHPAAQCTQYWCVSWDPFGALVGDTCYDCETAYSQVGREVVRSWIGIQDLGIPCRRRLIKKQQQTRG